MPRHIARNRQGDQLAVNYMLLPDSTTHALVSKLDAIPMSIQRALISLIDSPEAQRTEVLAEVLGRRTYADSGKSMLQVLHETGNLQRVPIDEVLMTPRANMSIPLRDILIEQRRIPTQQGAVQAEAQAQQGFNPHVHNQNAAVAEENVGIARNLIVEAEMLEADARSKRARAYGMAPQLDPRAAEAARQAAVEAQQSALAEVQKRAEGAEQFDLFGDIDGSNAPD